MLSKSYSYALVCSVMLLGACGGQEAGTAVSRTRVNADVTSQTTNPLGNVEPHSQGSAQGGTVAPSAAPSPAITSEIAQVNPVETTYQNSRGNLVSRVRLPMVPEYMGKIPDTGVTASQCYGAGGTALISCTSAAAIALNPQQDGMIGRDVTDSSSVDGQLGFSYSTVANSAGGMYDKTECVKDDITGLTWEGKTASGVHSKFTYYTYAQAAAFVADTNVSKLCGFEDWRLPTAVELQSLVDYGVASGDPAVLTPAIDRTWFPNTQDSYYLSSSAVFGTALVVGFSDGWTRGDSSTLFYVRLVRGAKITTSFVVSADGQEVTDTKAGLIWRRCAEGATFNGSTCIGSTETGGTSYSHEPAFAQAKTQAIATGLAWRLPNIKELANLSADLAGYTVAFPGAPEWLWSSTPQAGDPYSAWTVQRSGSVDASLGNRTVNTYIRMRLVRNAP